MSVKLMESQYKYIFMPQCPVYLPKLICKITWNFLGTKVSYFIHNISFKLIKNFVSFHMLTCLLAKFHCFSFKFIPFIYFLTFLGVFHSKVCR